MTVPDLINGAFELLGGVFMLNHCRILLRDKTVAGVSVVSVAFFLCWGLWNLYYYPHLFQWLSFFGAIAITSVNAIYLLLMIYYCYFPGGLDMLFGDLTLGPDRWRGSPDIKAVVDGTPCGHGPLYKFGCAECEKAIEALVDAIGTSSRCLHGTPLSAYCTECGSYPAHIDVI